MRDPLALVPAELTRVLGRDPGVYRTRALGSARAGAPRLWRVRGDSFSFVLKVHTRDDSREVPQNWSYWRREAEAYTSGLTEYGYVDSGLTAPVLMSRMDRADGTVALWLEDVPETPDARLDVRWVAEVARRLGRAQAGYPLGQALPVAPWLAQRWLRQYVAHAQAAVDGVLADDALWSTALARQHWEGLRTGLRALRADRRRMVNAVESLPRTLCHLRLSPRAVLASGDRCVLVDWTYCGIGAVGEDAGTLVAQFVLDGRHPVEDLPDLEHAVWRGYLDGLRAGGWDGDERVARLGMTAAAAARYGVVPSGAPRLARPRDRTGTEHAEEWFARTGAVLRQVVEWWEEAAGVARELGPAPWTYPRAGETS